MDGNQRDSVRPQCGERKMSGRPMSSFPISMYTSPKPLGKCISLGVDGKPSKKSLGQIFDGTVCRVTVNSLTEFAQLRASLAPNQALGYGITSHSEARVVTKAVLAGMKQTKTSGQYLPVVARDSQHLQFLPGPGLLMLDHDHDPSLGNAGLDGATLRERLCEAMPQLRQVSMIWAPSTSSMIYLGERELAGLRGSRIYLVVSDARRIPEIGRLLFDRLALAGHGRIAISGSGRPLRRGLIDASVWQPERLDYVRATFTDGLEQRHLPWELKVVDGALGASDEALLDVETVQPLTFDEAAALESMWKKLEDAARPEMDRVRRIWALDRAHGDMKEPIDAAALAAKAARYEASAATLVLEPEHVLTLADGRHVTVNDLLANKKMYDGVRMADPLEPEYTNDPRIAVAYLLRDDGSDPAIYSHAHGGTWYSLRRYGEDFEGLDLPRSAGASPCPLVEEKLAEPANPFGVVQAAEFVSGPPATWLIRDVLPKAELIVIYGKSGSGKSFIVLDMVVAIASGKPWCGLTVKQGRVVYVVAEGKAGFRKRLDALEQEHGTDLAALPLGIVARCPQLLEGDEVQLSAAIQQADGASVVVIDTLARTMGGGDESASTDMGKALLACTRIHEATGATIVLVHHAGKDASRGARGWSGLRAAADAELEVIGEKGSVRSINIKKQKDGEDSGQFRFVLDTVNLGVEDDDLQPVTSCVVRHVTDLLDCDTRKTYEPSGRWQRIVWKALPPTGEAIAEDSLVAAAVELVPAPPPGQRDTRAQSVTRAIKNLLQSGDCVDWGARGIGRGRQAHASLQQPQRSQEMMQ